MIIQLSSIYLLKHPDLDPDGNDKWEEGGGGGGGGVRDIFIYRLLCYI